MIGLYFQEFGIEEDAKLAGLSQHDHLNIPPFWTQKCITQKLNSKNRLNISLLNIFMKST